MDSEYLSPYLTTIVYDPKSVLQCAIAVLSNRAQLIPSGADALEVGAINNIEYLSPDVILFNETAETAQLFLDKGYQRVHIYRPDTCDLSNSALIDEFNGETIRDYINPADLHSAHILEHILGAECPKYTIVGDMSYDDCRYFVAGILHQSKTIDNLSQVLLDLANIGYRCFDKISEHIIAGKTLYQYAGQSIKSAVNYKLSDYNICAINNAINNAIITKTDEFETVNCDYLFSYKGDFISDEFVWFINITQINKSCPSPSKLITSILDNIVSHSEHVESCYIFLTPELAKSVLTFL